MQPVKGCPSACLPALTGAEQSGALDGLRRGGQAGYGEHAGSLELTCEGNHEGWRAAGLFPGCITGLSSGVSVDPLHVPLTSSTSSPPFPPPGPLLTRVAGAK